jgi:putative ABC transport system substrate-binding protein
MKKGLAERGYSLGRDLIFDERYAEGKPERFPALIADLLASGVEVLVPQGNAATLAAQRLTTTVPIVTVGDDLVGVGLAASLAHPGGNVTGIDVQASDYRLKWLDLLKTVTPNLRLLAVLSDPDETPAVMMLKEAAPRFGLTLTFLSARPPDLESSLAAVAAARFDGLIVNDNPSLLPQVPASPRWLPRAERRLSTGSAAPLGKGVSWATRLTPSRLGDESPSLPTGSSKARVPAIFRSSALPSSFSRSTSRPPGRLAWTFRRRCSQPPTR